MCKFPTQSNTQVSNERHLQRFVVVLTMVTSDGLIKTVVQPGGKKSSFVFTLILVKTTICDFFCIKIVTHIVRFLRTNIVILSFSRKFTITELKGN